MLDTELGAATKVRLLGPVEVLRDGHAVRLGGARQRALIALLALQANRVVTSEQLVSDLFGVDAPPSAVNAVQAAVSRLRRVLAEGMLETRPGGYILRTGPHDVDAAQFEQLLAEGRRLRESGNPAAAASTLRSAVALFRGAPLADVTSFEFARSEIRRLEELKVAALMERVDADLALGQSAELVAELDALIRQHPLQERLRGQLMLALYRCGRQADALDLYRSTRDLLRDELGLESSRALQELELAILRHDPELEPESPILRRAEASSGVVVCPFKGLAPFSEADASFFFGRERMVDELLARLATSPFVGLVGPSGSGKSSLLQAGLLAALTAGALPGSSDWRYLLMRPGDHDRLQPALSSEGRLVIAIDQLEELFTTTYSEAQQAAFLHQLAAAALDPARRFVVAVALRADFYGRCAAFAEFATLLSANHVLLGPMKRDELVRAIERPALEAGLQVERELVDALVGDVAGAPGELPLLSTALLELWRERDGRLLTHVSYRLSGGVKSAVSRLAEHAYAQLDDREQVVARGILLRLATEKDNTVVRRRVPLAELELGDNPDAARVVSVLADMRLLTVSDGTLEVSHEALLTEWPRLSGWLDEDRDGRRLRTHLATSAREWAERGRDAADLYRGPRLAAAVDWAEAGDVAPNALEREFVAASRTAHEREVAGQRRQNRRLKSLLAGAIALLAVAVAAGVLAFVDRSKARNEATIALARQLGAEALSEPRIDRAMLLARQAVELNRSTQTEGALLATLTRSPAAVATFTTPILARPQKVALSPDGRTLAVSDNLDSVRLYDTATRRVRHVLRHLGSTYAVAYTPDGSAFAAFRGTNTPVIDLIDAHTLRRIRVLKLDRRWLASQLGIGGFAPLLATPDGQTLLYAYDILRPDGSDGPAFLDRWDIKTGQLTTSRVGADGANDATLIDRGRQIAIGGTSAVTILDTRTLRRVRRIRLASPSPIYDDVVSPDGQTIAYGTEAGSVSFVNVATGRVTPGGGSHTAAVQAMQFSPNGQVVASSSDDGSVIIWDPVTAEPVQRLIGHAGRVHGLAFSHDSKTLYSNSLDGAIFEWDLGARHRFGLPFLSMSAQPRFGRDVPTTPPLALSPNGSMFAVRVSRTRVALYSTDTATRQSEFAVQTGGDISAMEWSSQGLLSVTGESGRVELWDLTGRPRLVRVLSGLHSTNGQPESVVSTAFTPDGSLIAAGDVNHTPGLIPYRFGTVAVWQAATGALLWKTTTRRGTVNSIAFSPNGRTLAAGYENGTVILYDARTGHPERSLQLEGGGDLSFETLAYAPDGTLATGTWAGIIQLWNPASGAELGHPTLVAAAPVAAIDFAPDGDSFATTGGSDGEAKIWTTSTLRQFGATFPGDPGQWGNAEFTPDGSRLIVIYADGKGFIWPATVHAWEDHACAVAGRNLTRAEWRQYVGDAHYETTCPGQPHVSGP